MPAPATFDTPRLHARRIDTGDFDLLCRMHRDPAVMATLLGVRDEAWTRSFLDTHLELWQQRGFGLWLFHDSHGAFVGRAGLHLAQVEAAHEVALAYALVPGFWGQGLATEMARAVVDIAFDAVQLPELVCFTLPSNRASARVMEKAGFRYERAIVHKELPHWLYRLTRADHEQGRVGA